MTRKPAAPIDNPAIRGAISWFLQARDGLLERRQTASPSELAEIDAMLARIDRALETAASKR